MGDTNSSTLLLPTASSILILLSGAVVKEVSSSVPADVFIISTSTSKSKSFDSEFRDKPLFASSSPIIISSSSSLSSSSIFIFSLAANTKSRQSDDDSSSPIIIIPILSLFIIYPRLYPPFTPPLSSPLPQIKIVTSWQLGIFCHLCFFLSVTSGYYYCYILFYAGLPYFTNST